MKKKKIMSNILNALYEKKSYSSSFERNEVINFSFCVVYLVAKHLNEENANNSKKRIKRFQCQINL